MDRIKLIKGISEKLNRDNIQYCILRNYDFLLKEKKELTRSEKSIDMVVSKKDMPKLDKLLTKLGFTKRKKGYSLKHTPYFKVFDEDFISFDIQVGAVHWNDMPYLDEKNILKNRTKKSFFYVPSDNDAFVMLLVHSILGKRYFKPEYKAILSSLSETIDNDYVFDRLKETFNKKTAEVLLDLAIKKRFNEIIKKKNALIYYFILKSPKHITVFTALFFRWIRWKIRLKPLITVMGPDGSGKSTTVKELNKKLIYFGRNSTVIYSGRGHYNVIPINKFGRGYKEKEIIAEKKGAPRKTTRKSLLYTIASLFYTLDMLLRYFLMTPKRMKECVITDRYCSDIFLMENVPFFIRRFWISLFPRPQLTFYLYNSVPILHKRSNGHNIENLNWQLKNFPILNKRFNSIQIKTENKEKTIQQVFTDTMTWLLRNWY